MGLPGNDYPRVCMETQRRPRNFSADGSATSSLPSGSKGTRRNASGSMLRHPAETSPEDMIDNRRIEDTTAFHEDCFRTRGPYMPTIREESSMSPENASPATPRIAKEAAATSPPTTPLPARGNEFSFRSPRGGPAQASLGRQRKIISFGPAMVASEKARKPRVERLDCAKDPGKEGDHDWEEGQVTPDGEHEFKDSVQILDMGPEEDGEWIDEDGCHYVWGEASSGEAKAKSGKHASSKAGARADASRQRVTEPEKRWEMNVMRGDDNRWDGQLERNEPRDNFNGKHVPHFPRRLPESACGSAPHCKESGRESAEGDINGRKRSRKEREAKSRKIRKGSDSGRDEDRWEQRDGSASVAEAAHVSYATRKVKGESREPYDGYYATYGDADAVWCTEGPIEGAGNRQVRGRRFVDVPEPDVHRVGAKAAGRHSVSGSSHLGPRHNGHEDSFGGTDHPAAHASGVQGHVAQGHNPPGLTSVKPVQKYADLDWPPGWERPAHMQPARQKEEEPGLGGAAAEVKPQMKSKKPSNRDPRRRKVLLDAELQELEPPGKGSALRAGPTDQDYPGEEDRGVCLREQQPRGAEGRKTSQRAVQRWAGDGEEGEVLEDPEGRNARRSQPGYFSAFLCPCGDAADEAEGCGHQGLQRHGSTAANRHPTAAAVPLPQIQEAGEGNGGRGGKGEAGSKSTVPPRRRPQWPDVERRSEGKENWADGGGVQCAKGEQGGCTGLVPQSEQQERPWISTRLQERERELRSLLYASGKGSNASTGSNPGEGHWAPIHEWPVSRQIQGTERREEEAPERKWGNGLYANERRQGHQSQGKVEHNEKRHGSRYEGRDGNLPMGTPQGQQTRAGKEDGAGARQQRRSESKARDLEEREPRRERSTFSEFMEEWDTDTLSRRQNGVTERAMQEQENGRSGTQESWGPGVSLANAQRGGRQNRDRSQWNEGGIASAQPQERNMEVRHSSREHAHNRPCREPSKDTIPADQPIVPRLDHNGMGGQGSGHLGKGVQGERSSFAPPRVPHDGMPQQGCDTVVAGNQGGRAEPKGTEGGEFQGEQQGEGKRRKRRSRWEDGGEMGTLVAAANGNVAAVLAQVQLPDFVRALGGGLIVTPELQTLHAQLVEINKLLKSGAALVSKDLPARERSPSPEPVYDNVGVRTNTREMRAREKLNQQRHDVITKILKLDPTFKPPSDYRPPRLFKKLYVPVKEYPGTNFVGLIIGPRGNTQKRLEKETGARITIRGKGSQKEGKEALALRAPPRDAYRGISEDSEDLHVLIEADNTKSLGDAAARIQALLSPTDAQHNEHKQRQLKELAELNGLKWDHGVCHFCGAAGHRQFQCPEKSKAFHAGITCGTCGSGGHPTGDCRVALKAGDKDKGKESEGGLAKLEEEYVSFLEEVGATGPEKAATTFPGAFPQGPKGDALPQGASSQERRGLGYGPPAGGVRPQQGKRLVFRDEECNVFVGCIPFSVDSERLQELFAPFGYVQEARVIMDRSTGRSRGFGFVLFADKDSAALAVQCMNGFRVDNKLLVVKPSQKGGANTQDPNAPQTEQKPHWHVDQHGSLAGPGVYRGPESSGVPVAYPYPAPWPAGQYPAFYPPYGVPCDPCGYPMQYATGDPSCSAGYAHGYDASYGEGYGEDVAEEAPPGAEAEQAPPGLEVGEGGPHREDIAAVDAMMAATFCPSLPFAWDLLHPELPGHQPLSTPGYEHNPDALADAAATGLAGQAGADPSEVHAAALMPQPETAAAEEGVPGCEPTVSLGADEACASAMVEPAPGVPGTTEALDSAQAAGADGVADMECSAP